MRKIFVLLVLLMLVFCLPTMAEDITPTLGDDSAYTLTEVDSSAGANVISRPYYNKETGELSVKYYRVDLRKTEYGEGGNSKTVNVKVIDKEVPVTVKYDDSTTKTYDTKYKDKDIVVPTVVNPTGTSSAHTQIDDTSVYKVNAGESTSIYNAIFENNSIKAGASSTTLSNKYVDFSNCIIYNQGEITSITADFVSNSLEFTLVRRSGSIRGYLTGGGIISNKGTIGDINGNFVNNTVSLIGGTKAYTYVYGGGLIGNSSSSIGDITGDFISNSVTVNYVLSGGGLIGNSNSSIGDITGDFISNTVTVSADYVSGGGLIGNSSSSIGDITGDFISNSVTLNANFYGAVSANYVYGGGLIGNYGSSSIGDITGDFISNTVTVSANYVYGGGLIGNYGSSSIGDITGDFISNTVTVGSDDAYGGGLIGNLDSSIGNITGDFISNSVTIVDELSGGGLIGNSNSSIGDITADFISNTVTAKATYVYGGLIGNFNSSIGDITGDFISNTVTAYSLYGGLIGNFNSSIGDITGDFISNSVTVSSNLDGGGVIGNTSSSPSSIGNITGDFISNSVTVSRIYGGGVIGNSSSSPSSIGNITGDFISNTVSVTGNYVYGGGVIGNYVSSTSATSTIGHINSKFYNNTLNLTSSSSQNVYGGGVIGNYGSTSTILGITGEFVNNVVIKETGSANVYSGVIYNSGTITNGITNSTFMGNYVKISSGTVYGGAIYTTTDLSINADNGTTLFSGNYTQVGTRAKAYNAVYVGSSSATLTLNAVNNGTIQLEDNINGANGYNVKLTGDSTGVVKLYNDIKNADVITDTVRIDTANGEIHEYNFNSLTSDSTTKYSIDIDLTNKTSDKFVVGNTSTGTITIDGLNILSGSFESITDETFKVQILHSQNDNIQLDLSDNIKSQLNDINCEIGRTTAIVKDDVQQDTKWTDIYNQYTQDTVAYGKLGLATTNTTNDSIGIAYDHSVTEDKVFDKKLDTLAYVNQDETNATKTFTTDDATAVYTLGADLGTTKGSLTVSGATSEDDKSTIDMNEHSGFVLENQTTLNLSNVKIVNAKSSERGSVITIKNGNSRLTINNVDFENNSIETNGNAFGTVISSTNYGKIGDINANFVGNTMNANGSWVEGGAIWNSNYSSIGNISGSFKSNTINGNQNNSTISGGAIYNNWYSTIKQINADFEENAIQGKVAKGGAIYNNAYSTIDSIFGTFIGNHADAKEIAQGGAIHNTDSTISEIKNSVFKYNYAKAASGTAKGGAIYTNSNVTVIADDGTSEFTGNYTQVGDGEKNYNAIYVDSTSATLNLQARNNGTINLNDNIDGTSGYDVKITGDGTGVVKLYNDIKNADVITDNVTVDTANGEIHEYTFNSLTSNANTKYVIDIDLTNKTSDKFNVGSASNGTITIDGLNILSGSFESITDETFKVQILNSQNDNIQLDLSDTIKSQLPDTNYEIGRTTAIVKDDVQKDTKWTDIYNQYTQVTVNYGKLGLATTNTTNDSIGIAYDHSVTEDKVFDKKLDTLAYVNQDETNATKTFTTDDATAVYTLGADLGTTKGSLTVSGATSEDDKSTIDMNEHSGFVLENQTTLNLSNVKIVNAKSSERGSVITIKNGNSRLTINNVDFENNSIETNGNAFGTVISSTNYGEIGDINANFVGNTMNANGSWVEGGAIWNSNYSSIGNISGSFESNTINGNQNNSTISGGAIYNNWYSTIKQINADFEENAIQGKVAKGGAIYNNAYSTIDSIFGTFIGNHADAKEIAQGGAIHNADSTISEIKNSVFKYNYAKAASGTAKGGAIYTNSNVTVIADDGTSEFTGNYTQVGDGEKNYNAIYVDSTSATLNLQARNNGTINLNDNIDGTQGYNVNITGDATGTLNMNNDIKNANVSVDSVKVNTANNTIHDYVFYSLNSNSNAKYSIDVDIANGGSADKFITTALSSGTIMIDSINFMNSSGFTDECIIQVIDNQNTSSTLSLVLGDNIVELPDAGDTVTNKMIIADVGAVSLTTTNTNNDSIKVNGKIYDNLAYINQKVTDNERNFNFVDNSTYYVKENLGTASAGTLNVNGKEEGGVKSTIDMNEHSGFVLENQTTLNLSNVKIVNAKSSERGSVITIKNGNSRLTINNVDFENNSIETNGNAFGTVISSTNYGEIGDINANFVGNTMNANGSWVEGGAIWNSNYSSIGNISGSFESNTINGNQNNSTISGGAIYNNWYSTIKQINADFEENAIQGKVAKGGAIYNNAYSTIDSIFGKFIGNHADGKESAQGGAIYNKDSNIGEIKNTVFKDNYVKTENGTAQGGAIYTNSNVTVIADDGTSEFTGNYTQVGDGEKNYNAIYVDSTSATLNLQARNNGTINLNDNIDGTQGYNVNITGDATGTLNMNNDIKNANVSVDSVKVNTANNTIHDYVFYSLNSNSNAKYSIDVDIANGGSADKFITTALSSGTIMIDSINFMNSSGFTDECIIQVIDNQNTSSTLSLVLGDNIVELPDAGDTVTNKMIIADVGAVSLTTTNTNNDSIKVNGKIYDNLAYINQKVTDNERNFNFVDNSTYYVKENLGTASAGTLNVNGKEEDGVKSTIDMNEHSGFVLENQTTLNLSNVKIVNAKSSERGSVITIKNQNPGINITNVDFENNHIESTGNAFGAVISLSSVAYGKVSDITGNFIENSVNAAGQWAEGGAIWNSNISSIENIDADFISNNVVGDDTNTTVSGGAIYNNWYSSIKQLNSDFENNAIQGKVARGGALCNNDNSTIESVSGTFVGNHADGKESAQGGAIYNKDSNIGEIKNTVFKDNYVKTENGTAQGGAIWTNTNLNIQADNGLTAFSGNYSEVNGVKESNAIYVANSGATLTLEAKNNGVIRLDDKISGTNGYKVNITGDGTGTFYMYNDMNNANVSMGNVNLGVTNNIVHNYNFNSFNLTGNVKMASDVDLVNKQMDRISANTYTVSEGAILTVTKLNLLNSTTAEKFSIKFAESDLANSVKYTGSSNVVKSPIYNYVTNYKVDENGVGYFNFVRGSSGNSNSYNPSALASSVSQQTGTYTTQLNTFNYAFQHAETFMNLPAIERVAYKNRNKYALSNVGVFSPLMTGAEDTGFWIKPYATFENIPLKNGPKVNSISYGTLVGYDELMVSLKHGWDRVFTYYLGYNGASQNYSGVDCYQNGGLLGATMTLYKGNFFTATTLSAGATVGEAHTMYGTEYSTTMFAGIGNKTGYNIEFNQGKFIVQPSMLLAYTFLNTFDYKNAAGVQINSDPTSMIQIAPTVRFVVNTKTGWQPYLAVGMVWNILAHSNIKANNEELPDMYTKPYVQYGLGVQRVIKDRFTAFGQAMIYNGGRNGVSLTAGIRYALGKDGHKHTAGNAKVVKDSQPKVVKELPQKLANSDTVSTKMINSDTVQATTDKKVASKKEVKKVKSDKNDKKVTKEKRFDFKLQQPSISIMR